MPDDNAGQDAPPVLTDLINRLGIGFGHSMAEFGQQIGVRMDSAIRAAFAHGVVEGMETCAKAAEIYAAASEQLVPDAPTVTAYIRQLRDQIRMSALSVEIPS